MGLFTHDFLLRNDKPTCTLKKFCVIKSSEFSYVFGFMKYHCFRTSILSGVLLFILLFFLISDEMMAQDTKYIESLITSECGGLIVEDFENDRPGQLPYHWFEQKGVNRPYLYPDEIKMDYYYQVVEENNTNKELNQFLRFNGVKAKHLNFPLHRVTNLDLDNTPILSWKWRIWDTPSGANENVNDLNDTAASIYVVFKVKKMALVKEVPQSIRYTWSSTLPVGTEISTFFGHQKIVVVGSGQKSLPTSEWNVFTRNLKEDYERLFGEKMPKSPLAILLLSDGDSTNDLAKADYDDISFLPLGFDR
jgi:hypothetical protein